MTICASCGQENPDGFRFCGACGVALAAEPTAAREERKVVTAVFCDVAGSTALGERLDPEAVRSVMARYFEGMRAVIERHGGTVEKFIGDAVMAVFGVPTLHEDDALRAVRAAVEMQAELDLLEVPARIGVNTGEVVVSGEEFVTGDAVNVAARLEQAAAAGEVLIGESTYRLVRDAVVAELAAPLAAKGKAEPLVAWRVRSVDTSAPGFARRLDAPLIGRQSESALLAEVLDRNVRERRCHLFTILGVAGAGKSRLVSEFLNGPATSATVLVGHCVSYGEGITYLPLAEMVRTAAAISEHDSPTVARQKLEALVSSPEAAAIADRVAALIGAGGAAASPDELAWAARKLFEGLAAERPLVVVFEDIHWAEATLLDLIENVADLSRGASILIVCSARPELLDARTRWAGGKTNATTILLEPLTAESARQLIETRADASGLSIERREQIVAAAEGNPLFVEQMLATLADSPEGGAFTAPSTIQALLAARLDNLPEDERQILERASVEGRVFHLSALAELVEGPRADLPVLLQRLSRRELIGPNEARFGGDQAYRFQHQLICDATYAHMSKRDRASRHEAFADWVRARIGERGTEYEEIVGYHLERAWLLQLELDADAGDRYRVLADRSGRLLASAGRRAQERGDASSAVGLLSRASNLLQEPSKERCQLLIDLTRALGEDAASAEALALARDAMRLADQLGDPSLGARAEIAVLFADADVSAEFDVAADADRLIETLTALGDDWGLALAWELRKGTEQAQMHGELAIAAAEHAAVHARRSNRHSFEVDMLLEIAGQRFFNPTPVTDALAWGDHVREAVAGDPRGRARLAPIVAALEAMGGNLESAGTVLAQRESIDADLGSRLDVYYQAQYWQATYRFCGDAAAAEAILRASLESVGPETHYALINRDMMAHAILAQGRFDEALELARQSEHSNQLPSPAFGADWRRVTARVLAHRGDHGEAVRLAREAAALVATTDYVCDIADTQMDLAIVLRVAGRDDEAAAAVTRAIDLWDRKGNAVGPARARAEFARSS